jgi:nucleoside-diphosphate-sugar epimerase
MTRQPAGRILVTGAGGFVGQALVSELAARNHPFRAVYRALPSSQLDHGEHIAIGTMDATTDWRASLEGVDCVVHLAARAHVMRERAVDAETLYRQTNSDATLALARQAADAGVSRFVFISTIKVNGDETRPGRPFTADDPPAPGDAYALSKLEAETHLRAVARDTVMHSVIIRPPLVYGPGVKGNFATMARLVARGIPLPLGRVDNRRTLISRTNLVDLILRCIDHRHAPGNTFLAGDAQSLSTPDLIRSLARAMGRPARLMPVPPAWLRAGARLAGKPGIAERLVGSLEVDISHTQRTLGWTPPHAIDDELALFARWHSAQQS